MDFELTEEQRILKTTVRKFAEEEIIPLARENDINESIPRSFIYRLGEMGFLGGPIPMEFGGSGLDYISYAILTEEIGRGCSSVRTTLSVQTSLVALTILKWGNKEQREKYLPRLCTGEIIGCFGLTEPNAGSDASNLSTTATSCKKSSWRLNGNKMWISNGGIADIAIIFAQTDPLKRHKGLAAFIVEKGTKGYSSSNIVGKLGLKASNTAQIILDNCIVDQSSILGKIGEGFKISMSALDNGRYSVAAGCVGIGQAALDASVKYSKERVQFDKAIGSFQLVQDMIGRMAVDIEASRLLVYKAGYLKNKNERSTIATSIAKYFASEMAVRAANDAVQIHGGYGYSNEYPVERYLRDSRVATIYEGTSQIQKLIIARDLIGIDSFK